MKYITGRVLFPPQTRMHPRGKTIPAGTLVCSLEVDGLEIYAELTVPLGER